MIAMVQSTNVSHLDKLRNQKTKNGAWYQTLVRWDIAIASCPAPLIRRGISTWFEPDILLTAEWAANFSCELSPGSHVTDSALCWKLAPFRPRHSQHKNTFFFFFFEAQEDQKLKWGWNSQTLFSMVHWTERLLHVSYVRFDNAEIIVSRVMSTIARISTVNVTCNHMGKWIKNVTNTQTTEEPYDC